MSQLLTLAAADLRQRVRDKSVLIFGLVVPIALMFVMNLVFSGAEDIEFEPTAVAITAAADDDLARAVIATLGRVDAFEINVDEVGADQVRPLVRDGSADLGIVVDGGDAASVAEGDQATVEVIEGEAAGLQTNIVISVTQAVAERFTSVTTATRAGAELGLSDEELAMVAQSVAQAPEAVTTIEGRTASEQLDGGGTMVAGQAGLFLLFTVGFGVLSLINEREQGTLVRLRSMPMRPGVIVAGKAISAYVLGVGATGVLLTVGGWMFDVSFGSVPLVAVLVLAVVAAATSLMFVVARLARTAEQAGVTQAILAVVLGMFGGAFFQIASGGIAGTLLELNPIGAFTRGLGIVAGGGQFSDLGVPLATMVGFAVIAAVASRLLPDRGAEL
ncbi:ABC transporter permease [Pseudactinotalea sp. Z1739]|uniref:ABC transporter permease n=1 Tax=Pseudactinotalea sp. Z1739 TaxID=3413028 RepID=UPI003C7C1A24